MKSSRLILLFLLIFSKSALAQLEIQSADDNILYKNGATGGIGIHNTGWYFGGRYYSYIDDKNDWLFEFDFSRNKHPKEYRNTNNAYVNARSFVFGKLNDYFNMRMGVGRAHTLFDKAEKNGVAIRYAVSGGLSLGLLKPVYLDFVYSSPGDPGLDIRSERATVDKFYSGQIYGASEFTTGLNEISLKPGYYGKFALLFDWSTFSEDLRVLECGVTVDGYLQPLEIMAVAPNKQFFVSFYVGLHFGGHW